MVLLSGKIVLQVWCSASTSSVAHCKIWSLSNCVCRPGWKFRLTMQSKPKKPAKNVVDLRALQVCEHFLERTCEDETAQGKMFTSCDKLLIIGYSWGWERFKPLVLDFLLLRILLITSPWIIRSDFFLSILPTIETRFVIHDLWRVWSLIDSSWFYFKNVL